MGASTKHHYLAVFYLQRWVGPDDLLCRFAKRPDGSVSAKRIGPKGTGYQHHLYETSAFPAERIQAMETDFMAPLDDQAAQALMLLESGLPEGKWDSKNRSAWSRFLLTQMLRSPKDIAQLKSSVTEEWGRAPKDLEQAYLQHRRDSDPATLTEFLAMQGPAEAGRIALAVGRTLMNHEAICGLLNNWHWKVVGTPDGRFALLTSDQPVWMTPTLTEPDAFLSMPIGPQKLFIAARDVATLRRLSRKDVGELAFASNLNVVRHARRYAYGLTDRALSFVEKHMTTRRHPSLLERLARKKGHHIVAKATSKTLSNLK